MDTTGKFNRYFNNLADGKNMRRSLSKLWRICHNPSFQLPEDESIDEYRSLFEYPILKTKEIAYSEIASNEALLIESRVPKHLRKALECFIKLYEFEDDIDESYIREVREVNNDIFGLAIAYSCSISDLVYDGMVDKEDVFDLKTESSWLVKEIVSFSDCLKRNDYLSDTVVQDAKSLLEKINKTSDWEVCFRSLKLVPVKPKKMSGKEPLIKEMIRKVPDSDYKFIVPIARGGLEPAHKLSIDGFGDLIYPIMYSRKTRKHRNPHLEYDATFLEEIHGEDVLIVDDWITSGRTVADIYKELVPHEPSSVSVATIKQSPESLDNKALKGMPIFSGGIRKYLGDRV